MNIHMAKNWLKMVVYWSFTHKEIRSIFFPLPYEDGSRAVIGVK